MKYNTQRVLRQASHTISRAVLSIGASTAHIYDHDDLRVWKALIDGSNKHEIIGYIIHTRFTSVRFVGSSLSSARRSASAHAG